MHARDISVLSRATQGVRLINLDKRGDEIASICPVVAEEEQSEEGLEALEHSTELGDNNNAPAPDVNTAETTDPTGGEDLFE